MTFVYNLCNLQFNFKGGVGGGIQRKVEQFYKLVEKFEKLCRNYSTPVGAESILINSSSQGEWICRRMSSEVTPEIARRNGNLARSHAMREPSERDERLHRVSVWFSIVYNSARWTPRLEGISEGIEFLVCIVTSCRPLCPDLPTYDFVKAWLICTKRDVGSSSDCESSDSIDRFLDWFTSSLCVICVKSLCFHGIKKISKRISFILTEVN